MMVLTNQNQSFDMLVPPYGRHRFDCWYQHIAGKLVSLLQPIGWLARPETIRYWVMARYPSVVRTEDEAHRVLIIAWGRSEIDADLAWHPSVIDPDEKFTPGRNRREDVKKELEGLWPDLEEELRHEENARLAVQGGGGGRRGRARDSELWGILHDGSVWGGAMAVTMLPHGSWDLAYRPVVVSWDLMRKKSSSKWMNGKRWKGPAWWKLKTD